MAFPTHTPVCPIDLTPDCPWAPPDWRWQRAANSLPTCHDPWCEWLATHQSGIPTEAGAGIIEALTVHAGDPLRRAEIEARVLADQPTEAIAQHGQISSAAVEAYEAVFFDVRSRLQAHGWIIYQAIGLKPSGPLQDVALAWQYYGFMFGACALDALLAGADREVLETIGLPAYWSSRSRLPKEVQLSLLARSLPEFGRKALKSLSRFVDLGLSEMSPRVVPPPAGLALDLSGDIESDLASWDAQPDTQWAASEGRFARVA